jgi:environmental stress-induced protein Ves
MSWQLIRLDDVAATPWRNGGGVTRELLAWPLGHGGVAADWDWRLSVAEVTASGPFSRFDGVQRWFAVLQGEGVRLALDGIGIDLSARSAPFLFDGGAAVDCQLLAGATQDFNLMLRRGRGQATMQRVSGQLEAARMAAGTWVAAYNAGALAHLHLSGEDPLELPTHCLAWRQLDAPANVLVQADAALWLEISR